MMKTIDIDQNSINNGLEPLFPGWDAQNERVCVIAPHDDDGIIGTGYVLLAAKEDGAEVFAIVVTDGSGGYSTLEEKATIKEVRKKETIAAYKKLGLDEDHIIFFDIPDTSVINNMGRFRLNGEEDGVYVKILKAARKNNITRLLVPNHYWEHPDHTPVATEAIHAIPYIGMQCFVDWYEPSIIKSVAQYQVWGDFDPEDAFIAKRDCSLRANRIILVNGDYEERVASAISEWKSQGLIIQQILEARTQKRAKTGEYIELYRLFDPQPKIDYQPYVNFVEKLI